MISSDLAKLLADLPDEALIPVGWVRKRLDVPEMSSEDAIGDLSCAQVAKELGRKPGTVRGFCARGEIKAYLLNGRDWRIPRASLRAYLDHQRAGKH